MKRLLMLGSLVLMTMLIFVPAAQAADPEDRVIDILNDAANDTGTVGVYLRQVGGPTIAASNESFVFEPASTIKALIHFHAMKQVEDDPAIDLTTNIPWFAGPATYNNSPPPGTSCPDNSTLPGNETLSNSLQQMMGPSDNRRTQALRDFFGDANINATRIAFGMTNTGLNHLIGCGADAVANPNQLTLVDAGLMYAAVFTGGFLADPATAASLMTQDNGAFNAIIDTESAGMGLSAASINQFKSLRQSANKAGSYGLSTGQYRTVAGWSTVPWKDASTCEVDVEDYVYGAFIHAADSIDPAVMGIRNIGVELFREEIHAALESWMACEADLQITSSTVVHPPTEVEVNTPFDLTVRVAMRNNGPASVIDGVLSLTPDVPADCTVSPDDISSNVPNMAEGNLVVQEHDFTIECSNPSFHDFSFDSILEPAIDAVVDTDVTNNDGFTNTTVAVIARADVAVTSWDFSELDNAQIQDILIGEDFLFSTPKTLDNFGDIIGNLYTDSIDTIVTRSIEVPAGVQAIVTVSGDEAPATVTVVESGNPPVVHNNQAAGSVIKAFGPATITVEFAQDSLAINEARGIVEEFGLRCLSPGEHDLVFVNAIAAVDQHVVDPDETNNSVEVHRTIDCVTPVQINFHPGNAHNFVNVKSNAKLSIAILTTEVGEYGLPIAFDATTVDYATVRFGEADVLNAAGGSIAAPDKKFIRDAHEVTNEKLDKADDDMVLLFKIDGTGFSPSTTEGCAYGDYILSGNAYSFFGCDTVVPKP